MWERDIFFVHWTTTQLSLLSFLMKCIYKIATVTGCRQCCNPGSHIDLHSNAGRAPDNRMTLTFDLLTLGSKHAEVRHGLQVYQV